VKFPVTNILWGKFDENLPGLVVDGLWIIYVICCVFSGWLKEVSGWNGELGFYEACILSAFKDTFYMTISFTDYVFYDDFSWYKHFVY